MQEREEAERLAAFAKGQAPAGRRKPRYRLAAQLGPFQALLKRTFEQGGPPATRATLALQRRMQQGPDARSSSQFLPRPRGGREREGKEFDGCAQVGKHLIAPSNTGRRGRNELGRCAHAGIDQAEHEKVECPCFSL
jgi:hypothetical protein